MKKFNFGVQEVTKKSLRSMDLLNTIKYMRNVYYDKQPRLTLLLKGLPRNQFLVSANQWGLCNRIKCFITSLRFADRLQRKTALSWIPNNLCYCRFSDLFENEVVELNKYELSIIMNKPGKSQIDQWYLIDTWRLLTLPDELPENFIKAYKSATGKGIDHEYDRIPLTIRDNYLTYINALIPGRIIKNEVESFSRRFNEKTISVSIRSWPEAEYRTEALFRLEDVYRVMDKEEDSSFFVSCDSEGILKKIKSRYGQRVICYPHRTFVNDRHSIIGMQDILIDLLLLSKNDRLKVSAYSAFSEMAWWFGGCRASVECINDTSRGQGCFLDLYADRDDRLIPSDLLERAAKYQVHE